MSNQAGNPFRKVTRGDRLSISAQAWNVLMDLARRRAAADANGALGSGPVEDGLIGPVIWTKNNSASTVDRFGVLGVDSVVITHSDNAVDFSQSPALDTSTPSSASHAGKFVITAEAINAGEIGRAYALGVTPVQINITDASHKYADVKNGDATQLQSATGGLAQILWVESGTGSKWALVRLGGGGVGTQRVFGTLTAHAAVGGSTVKWNYTASSTIGVLSLVRNGCEPLQGTPGRLGVNVGTDGSLTGTSCFAKPFEGIEVWFDPDPTVPGGWMFSLPNSFS